MILIELSKAFYHLNQRMIDDCKDVLQVQDRH